MKKVRVLKEMPSYPEGLEFNIERNDELCGHKVYCLIEDGWLEWVEEPKSLEEKIEQTMFKWDRGNFTVCPECHVDDFVHVVSCPRADNGIIERLAQIVKDHYAEILDRLIESKTCFSQTLGELRRLRKAMFGEDA